MPLSEIIFLLIIAAAVAVLGILYGHYRERGHFCLFFKGAATGMAVITACRYAAYHTVPAAVLIACALLLCMAADVLLEIRFLTGVAAFGAAHVCLILSFLEDFQLFAGPVLLWILLYGGMFLGFRRFLKQLGKLTVPGFIYAALLCAVCALSICRFLTLGTLSSGSAALGGICFFASDNILAYCTLSGSRSKRNSAILLTLYYSAVYFLAVSLYI